MGHDSTGKAPETDTTQGVDMTELMAAVALLNNEEPPSDRVIVPISAFPDLEKIQKKEKEEVLRKAGLLEAGHKMTDGTFYLGRLTSRDGTEKDWFAAAEDIKDETGNKLLLNFNQAVRCAGDSSIHGHNDWSIPPGFDDSDGEPNILNVLFNNKAKIGGLNGDWYWSSSPIDADNDYMKVQKFVTGDESNVLKNYDFSVRLVRCVPAS